MNRRKILKRMAAGAFVLLMPVTVMAQWVGAAFSTSDKSEALKLIGAENPVESEAVTLKTPEIAENGAIVPVSVSSTLDEVSSISIFVDKNPNPLTSQFDISPDMESSVSVRIRMGETSMVSAVVIAAGKAYKTSKEVKVTIGGCGG